MTWAFVSERCEHGSIGLYISSWYDLSCNEQSVLTTIVTALLTTVHLMIYGTFQSEPSLRPDSWSPWHLQRHVVSFSHLWTFTWQIPSRLLWPLWRAGWSGTTHIMPPFYRFLGRPTWQRDDITVSTPCCPAPILLSIIPCCWYRVHCRSRARGI